MNDWIAILDFGSQYTHLIARRVRECKVYSEILPYNISAEELSSKDPKAIILSGGPASVNIQDSPICDKEILNLGIPILGICYGAQLIATLLGGEVSESKAREYGKATLKPDSGTPLFKNLGSEETIWMSHQDKITKLPPGFEIIGKTKNSPIAAMKNKEKKLYALQFHPEVVHTPKGKEILDNFLSISNCKKDWSMESFVKKAVQDVRNKVGDEKVVCALSGGVDSSVMATLFHKAVGDNLITVFIDNGLLRKDEATFVKKRFKKYFDLNLKAVQAQDTFISALEGVEDPEKKRKIIGRKFIEEFEKQTEQIGDIKFLAQGTLYPDVIESISPTGGPSATIKSHHNVGGLPEKLNFELIEPLKDLFKDEVRDVGKELGLPDEVVHRQPFPGPGLAIRIVGPVTKGKLDILREADWILTDKMKESGLYYKLWQTFCVLLPIKSVGVMGDERTYENVIVIRAVTSKDGMTAQWAKLPDELLEDISNSIINEVKGINRVVYDISSKPPGTIEWE